MWTLVARLEARAAGGYAEHDVLVLLARARTALGVSLGTVLPEERLSVAATWTGKALTLAECLDDPTLLAHALRMHGNELRKAGRPAAAVARLVHALDMSDDRAGRGAAYALLARATADMGNQMLFDEAINAVRALLGAGGGQGMLFNVFACREIELRGLVATGRSADAVQLMRRGTHADLFPVAPQWYVIERVTAGQVYLAACRRHDAEDALRAALTAAEARRLPHQVQRAVRIADEGNLAEISADGRAALHRLNVLLSRV